MFDFNAARFAQFGVNVLAVAGGFLVGQLVFWLLAKLLDHWLTGGRSPQGLHKVIRLTGGTLVAILVALIVFGHGDGWNLFGGGGLASTNGGTGDGGPPTVATSPTDKKDVPAPPVDGPPPADVLRITILGGDDVRDAKFYQLGTDKTPLTYEQVTAAVEAKRAGAKALGLELRFASQNVLPVTHPAVTRLTAWARNAGVSVTLPADRP